MNDTLQENKEVQSKKVNILLVGNSGVGKSTLINSIMGSSRAETGAGEAVSYKMKIYENDELSFRLIDSRGFEYDFLKQKKTIKEIMEWSKDSIKKDKEEKKIHMVWYCIDATSKRLTKKSINLLDKVISIWPDVPMIVVLTKSYSETERDEDIDSVRSILEEHRKNFNILGIIPVVAEPYRINDEICVEPTGLTELIELTEKHIPEALRISQNAFDDYILKQKRSMANALVVVSAGTATTVGAVPIPFSDAFLLTPLETGMITGIGKIYGLSNKDNFFKQVLNNIVKAGTVSAVAKGSLKLLQAIPGIGIGVAALNAIAAGVIVSIIGESSVVVMEKIYKGELSEEDIDWISKFVESGINDKFMKYVTEILNAINNKNDKNIGAAIKEFLFRNKKSNILK